MYSPGMYTIVHRTGTSRGRVYSYQGVNLTADPVGAGNDMVGPWALDYVQFIGPYTAGLPDPDPAEGQVPVVAYSPEYSGIIMDGRAMAQATGNDDSLLYPDLDEDEDLSDRGSIIGRDTKRAGITSGIVRLYHTAPAWQDGRVYLLDQNGTAVEDELHLLDEWLDYHAAAPGGTIDDNWATIRHALRVPVFWAIYRIRMGPNYESLAEMIVENTATVVGQGAQLSYGPYGMLTALHGAVYASQHAVRLYEPNIGEPPIARGMFHVPYDSATVRDRLPSDGSYPEDPDRQTGTDYEMLVDEQWFPFQNDTGVHLDTPSQRARGRIYTTAMRIPRIKASPDEMIVWHFQTAPVRLTVTTDVGANLTNNVVIGGPASAFYGPPVRIVYHECSVRYHAR